MKKRFISERELLHMEQRQGKQVHLPAGSTLTPLAFDTARVRGITFVRNHGITAPALVDFASSAVAVGCDHTGYHLKKQVLEYLRGKGINCVDVGCHSTESCDYPDFASAVGREVTSGRAASGIVLDATGSPSAMVCNKIKGIRAAVLYNEFSAKSARSHNNANIACIGAKAIGELTVLSILDVWFATKFEGGRHQKRLDKMEDIEG